MADSTIAIRQAEVPRKIAPDEQGPRFERFPELPTEIRLKIWREAAEPRIVEICQDLDSYAKEAKERGEEEPNVDDAPFYSSTKIPSIFRVNQESRSVALQEYPLSFPNGEHPARIYFNPGVDTLYFPAWCFERSIDVFEERVPTEEKKNIRRLAVEFLIWYGSQERENYLNNEQIDLFEFPNLEELLLVHRLPDHTGCGCCHMFEGPERGVVSFEEYGNKIENGQVVYKEVKEESQSKDDESPKRMRKDRMLEDVCASFQWCKEEDPDWSMPNAKRVELKRDGVRI
ncbi:hypothetical protein G7Y89_g1396 [Cudoniella acicularis]|uniref:2EXR domain-containing protein n=1 Tax=Cudoniella acicularis TaxID=354080 RepID=A0A8H4W7Z0_9HELO|nr:hypothetical protein G7Y89_g1396 [Cudoniella acicularis]